MNVPDFEVNLVPANIRDLRRYKMSFNAKQIKAGQSIYERLLKT